MAKLGNPGRESKMLRCRLPPRAISALRAIALETGFIWGGQPSIGKLLEAIAQHPRAIVSALKDTESDD